MRFGVVGEQMSAHGDFANEFGTSLNKAAHQKKGSARLVALQQIEQIRRNARIGAIVEGQCNLASCAALRQMMNRLAEDLRGWRDGCPASRTNCRCSDYRRTYGPGIQIETLSGLHTSNLKRSLENRQTHQLFSRAALLSY